MNNTKKLSPGHKNILSLIRKGAMEDGWAPVSHARWRLGIRSTSTSSGESHG